MRNKTEIDSPPKIAQRDLTTVYRDAPLQPGVSSQDSGIREVFEKGWRMGYGAGYSAKTREQRKTPNKNAGYWIGMVLVSVVGGAVVAGVIGLLFKAVIWTWS